MKSFLLKVELHHDKAPYDYDNLHKQFYAVGFYRTILLKDGHWYDLPHGEYIYNSDDDLLYVLDFVRGSINLAIPGIAEACYASRKQKSYSITLAESEGVSALDTYKTKYVLYRANRRSKLPPGVVLV